MLDKWYYCDEYLEVVDSSTYLGIAFNFNNKSKLAEKRLSDQSRKALFTLYKNCKDMYLNHETMLSLFDCYVGNICNYASEIWGNHTGGNIEKNHLDFCKKLMGVKKKLLVMLQFMLN
jgi:hypothetical protein